MFYGPRSPDPKVQRPKVPRDSKDEEILRERRVLLDGPDFLLLLLSSLYFIFYFRAIADLQ